MLDAEPTFGLENGCQKAPCFSSNLLALIVMQLVIFGVASSIGRHASD